jgi:hypothetical protein
MEKVEWWKSTWSLLRSGKTDEGLQRIEIVSRQEPNPSHTMALGVACLWAKSYEQAWNHFDGILEKYPKSASSNYYAMAGTAKWCLGEHSRAAKCWSEGLNARYADAGGLGLRLPLILFFGSTLQPVLIAKDIWQSPLLKKIEDSRVDRWPGPIAKWLLGEFNDHQLEDSCKGDDELETQNHLWEVAFYKAVRQHHDGRVSRLAESMRSLSDTSQPVWSDHDFFLARVWNVEFFLARHEAIRGEKAP